MTKTLKEIMNNLDRFKFRAYDKISKKLVDIKILDFGSKSIVTEKCLLAPMSNFELMQCTGLKDKNSKLIYEGDIISLFDMNVKFKKAVVYFKDGCFYADDKDPKGNCSLGYLVTHKRNVVVVGNIHENPELLKENDQ